MIPENSFSRKTIIESVFIIILFIVLLLAVYDILKVFFGILTFALIFTVSFFSLFEKMVKALNNRRGLASFIYAFVLIGAVAIPFIYLISALAHHVRDLMHLVNETKTKGLPPIPEWISGLPKVGPLARDFWTEMQNKPGETLALHEQQVRAVLHRILNGGAGLLGTSVEIVAGILVSTVFLRQGERISRPFRQAVSHILGPENAEMLLNVTVQAIRGVSGGVIGTAFIAAIVSWMGLVIAGIQFALALSAIVFFLVLIQAGPLFVWVPLFIYMISTGHTGLAIFTGLYGVLLLGIDMIVKPLLIAKSGKLPFLLLFVGVIGGMSAWGFTGMFKGAIILAIFYTIFSTWLDRSNNLADDPAAI